jgi:hypothetical protein
MNKVLMKKSLPAPSQRLVRLMQKLHFGEVLDLEIRSGQPDFTNPPRLMEAISLGCESGPHAEVANDDFQLKNSVVKLLETLERVGEGRVTIRVRHGLPTKLHVERPLTV